MFWSLLKALVSSKSVQKGSGAMVGLALLGSQLTSYVDKKNAEQIAAVQAMETRIVKVSDERNQATLTALRGIESAIATMDERVWDMSLEVGKIRKYQRDAARTNSSARNSASNYQKVTPWYE